MIRGFRQIAVLTAISRVFGLVRDICYSHFFGADKLLDAWIIAFRIPNLSRRLFGEGAASASLIPVYSKTLHEDAEQARNLANTVLTALFVVLAGLVLLGEAGIWIYYKCCAVHGETELILSLSAIMLPYTIAICIVAILAGILNVHRHFAAPAAAPIVLNLFIIATIVVTGSILDIGARQQFFVLANAILVAGVVQLLMQTGPLRRAGVRIRPAWEVRSKAFIRILLMMAPMIVGLTVTQINTLADDLIAWWFSGSEEKGQFFMLLGRQIEYPMWRGSVSHLYYAQRLYQLPLGVFGISLATAIFPVMSANAAAGDYHSLCKSIRNGLGATIFIAVPATVGLIIIAQPLIAAAFQHGEFEAADTKMVAFTLAFYAAGLCGYFAQQILARAFFSMEDSKTPMKSACLALAVNFLLNLTLIWLLGRAGLACATAICSYLQVVILLLVLRKRLGNGIFEDLGPTVVNSVLGTAILAVCGLILVKLLAPLPQTVAFNIVRLLIIVPVAAGVYWGIAAVRKEQMLALVKRPAKTMQASENAQK